jgi:hypothetical protein
MMKKFYGSAWFLLAAAVLVAVLTGALTPVSLFVFSLVALALVYTLVLWLVITNTRDLKTE